MGKLRKAISVDDIYKKTFETMAFTGKWKDSFGTPELGGSWFVWGNSTNGKTSFIMQLAKYLCGFGKVLYNSFEEGGRMSFQDAVVRNNMREVSGKFTALPGECIDDLVIRLERRYSANIVVIDSIQHARLTKQQFETLKQTFPKKLFIYISHARGKQPKGEVADFIKFDSDLKLWVEGFRCFPDGRLRGGREFFDIWPQQSKVYWQEIK